LIFSFSVIICRSSEILDLQKDWLTSGDGNLFKGCFVVFYKTLCSFLQNALCAFCISCRNGKAFLRSISWPKFALNCRSETLKSKACHSCCKNHDFKLLLLKKEAIYDRQSL